MKKTKRFALLLSALLLLCSLLVLVSCGGTGTGSGNGNNNAPPSSPKKLTTPTVVLNGNTATWSADASADRFEISLDGELSYIESTVTSKKLGDGQTFKIRAIGDGTNYTNSDWSNAVTYQKQALRYTVTWKCGDTILETDEDVPYGTIPSYDGAEPVKEATAQYTYKFSGWSPEIRPVTESVTYQAQFTSAVRTYTLTFFAEDGVTVLARVTVEYGGSVVYPKEPPVKNDTEKYSFLFEGWVTKPFGAVPDDLTNVVADRNVYASFKRVGRTATVTIVPDNADYGSVTASVLKNIPYGTEIVVNGNTVTINGQTVAAVPKSATAQYTYAFVNWTVGNTVNNDTTIVANFSRTLNTYTVTWKNGDTVLKVDENVPYGTTPVYRGEPPVKESDGETDYLFSGWSPAVSSVTCDVTYVATFTSAAENLTVIFYDDDGVTELGRVVVPRGGTAVYPNAVPTKKATERITYTFEMWVTQKGGTTEATFTDITKDTAVYAKYAESVRHYTVKFLDYDGSTLKEVEVEYGADAEAPGDPERSGYRFAGWDRAYSEVTEDLIVKATYIRQVTITFLDYDGSILDIQLVDYNGSATAPQDPERSHYRFTGWNTVFDNVVNDLTVKAEYIRQYTIIFLGHDGTVLKKTEVDEGASAIAPEAPALAGYHFDGWDKAFTEVSSDLTVTAIYSLITFRVKFVLPDGTVIGEEQTIEAGSPAEAPEPPEFFLSGTGVNAKVFTFTGWNKTFDKITEDLVVEALYETAYTKPVLIVDLGSEPHTNITVYIYNCHSITLNAVELKINYKTDAGEIEINSVTFAGVFKNNDKPQYVINNNEKTFSYAWSDGTGISYDSSAKVMTLDAEVIVGGTTIRKDTFVVEDCNMVISENEGKPEKIIPPIIYR